MVHPLRKFWKKNLTGPGQVTELLSSKAQPVVHYQQNRFFGKWTCCHWPERGYQAWISWDDHISHLASHFDPPKFIRSQWPWQPHTYSSQAVFLCLLRLWDRVCDSFSTFIVPLDQGRSPTFAMGGAHHPEGPLTSPAPPPSLINFNFLLKFRTLHFANMIKCFW